MSEKQNSKTKNRFSPEEDNALKNLVEQIGLTNWHEISQIMNNNFSKDLHPRTYKKRYENYLAPELNFSPWTLNEDILLMQLHDKLGDNWVDIAKWFDRRTSQSLESRYNFVKSHRTTEEELENYLSGSKPISIYKKIPAAKEKSDSTSIQNFVIPEINGINL